MMLMEDTIKGYLERSFKLFEDNLAIIYPEGNVTYTYREMLERIDVLSKGLLSAGVTEESQVALYAQGNSEWIMLYLAIARIGAVPVCLNENSTFQEIQYTLLHTNARFMIASRELVGETFDISLFSSLEKVIFLEPTFSIEPNVMDMQQLEEKAALVENQLLRDYDELVNCQEVLQRIYIAEIMGGQKLGNAVLHNMQNDISTFLREYENGQDEKIFAVIPLEEIPHNLFTVILTFLTGGSVVLVKNLSRSDVEETAHAMGHPTVRRIAPMTRYILKISKTNLQFTKEEQHYTSTTKTLMFQPIDEKQKERKNRNLLFALNLGDMLRNCQIDFDARAAEYGFQYKYQMLFD